MWPRWLVINKILSSASYSRCWRTLKLKIYKIIFSADSLPKLSKIQGHWYFLVIIVNKVPKRCTSIRRELQLQFQMKLKFRVDRRIISNVRLWNLRRFPTLRRRKKKKLIKTSVFTIFFYFGVSECARKQGTDLQ